MSRCEAFLNEILGRSGLERNDGHPLYAYRITLDELERIRAELISRFKIAGRLRQPTECAAFCMFASEWFRRKYERGVWKWQTIFDGLELSQNFADSIRSQFGDYTINGLKWWNLDVIRTAASQRYLTTLVCQGGFPINILRNEGASLSRVLKMCLRQHELYPSESIHDIVAEFIGILPETLQEAEVRSLLAHVVLAVAELRRKSEAALETGQTRRSYLDKNAPGWHGRLPFRIDDDQEAQTLILSLLDASKARILDRQPLAIQTNLTMMKDGSFQLQRSLQHPASIETASFNSICGRDANALLYSRMSAFLSAGDARVQACTIAKPFEGTVLKMQAAGVGRIVGTEAAMQTTLLVRSGNEMVVNATLPGGESLPFSPWVFGSEEPFDLLGVGSLNTRHETVFVAPTDSAEVQGEDCLKTDQTVDGRVLYRISGAAEVRYEDTIYRIRTRQKVSTDVIYELRGHRQHLGAFGSEVWLGAPDIYELPLGEAASRRKLDDREISWRPSKGGNWSRLSDRCLGDIFIRAVVDGECKFMSRITVLPRQFKLTTRPGHEENQGQWIFVGLGQSADLHFATAQGVNLKGARKGKDIVVDVDVQEDRPRSIPVKVRWSDDAVCQMELVCPTQNCSLVEPNGNVLDKRMVVSVDQLDGLRVRLLQPGARPAYLIDCERTQIIDTLTEVSPGIWEYPLTFAKDRAVGLLASSDDPDSEIELGITIGNALVPMFRWKVGRYGYRLEPLRHVQQLADVASAEQPILKTRVQVADPQLRRRLEGENVSVRVIALNDPKLVLPPESVSQESDGVWRIDHVDADPGYYLVTGKTDSGNLLRPTRFQNKLDQLAPPPSDKPENDYCFTEISSIRDRDRRREVWDRFFERMIEDFGHEEWAQVQSVTDASLSLPVTTFETVAALTRNPIAVARFGILNPGNAKLWQRLEELPFLWCLVPVSAWLKASLRIIHYVRERMEGQQIAEDTIMQIINVNSAEFATKAPDRIPSMNCVTACFFFANLVDPKYIRMTGTTREDFEAAFAALVRRHERFDSRLTWPRLKLRECEQVKHVFESMLDLEYRDVHQHEWAVVNGPAIAAIYSVYGFPMTRQQVCDFKLLRSFDMEWFDAAHHYAMHQVATRRFEVEPDWIQQIVDQESGRS